MINFKYTAMLFALLLFFEGMAQQSTPTVVSYIQTLKNEGWHRNEINILNHFYYGSITDLKSKKEEEFKPYPKPNLESFIDIVQLQNQIQDYQIHYQKFAENFPQSKEYRPVSYSLVDRKSTDSRSPGLWKNIKMYSTSGRIYDLELDPNNPDNIYANPDGDGIYLSRNGGRNWTCISDNIPERQHRNAHENIIVNPKDFGNVFMISRFGMMYETKDFGKNWSGISSSSQNGKAPQFKWVEAFFDSQERLVLIGSVRNSYGNNPDWKKGIYRSENRGKDWVYIEGTEQIQEIEFHKKDPQIVFSASNNTIYISKNAGKNFDILRKFEFGNRPAFMAQAANATQSSLYIALSNNNHTRVYFSSDNGKTWDLKQDSENKIGFENGIFGSDGSSEWTSFFEIDPFDHKHLIASSVASCESFDAGVTWEYQSWGDRSMAQMEDGQIIENAPHGGHNADNHVLKFHPMQKDLMIKGCDAGIMKKRSGDKRWININGDMPAFLWYSVVVNEFGERYISGNTQDVNIQTFRYGKWENERGYEGDAIFMNPSTNTTYYPTAETEIGEGLGFLEPGFWKMHSWSYPKVAVDYKCLDNIYIAYGRRPTEREPQLPKYLYKSANRGVAFEQLTNFEVFAISVARDSLETISAFGKTEMMRSIDKGNSWIAVKYPEIIKPGDRNRAISAAVDPNNPNRIWLAGKEGKVVESTDSGKNWKEISLNLPQGNIQELLFHEGSQGDLYVLVSGFGVFYKNNQMTEWKLWMDGYNLESFTEIRIDYPYQRLLASSYGRGLWEADLENTYDRFLSKSSQAKIIYNSKVNGKHVFYLEFPFEIPEYYNLEWKLNDKSIGDNSKILKLDRFNKKDHLTVEITQKNCPQIKSIAQFEQFSEALIYQSPTDYSTDCDLKNQSLVFENVDFFGENKDFTFTTWIKPNTQGIIVANRRVFYRDAKGWFLEIGPKGEIIFNGAFYQNRSLDRTYNIPKDQSIEIKSPENAIELGKWQHIALSFDRDNAIKIFVNGKIAAQGKLDTELSHLSLNSVFDLCFLSDPYRIKPLNAQLKSLSFYNKSLSDKEVIKEMKNARKFSAFEIFKSYNDGDTKFEKDIISNQKIYKIDN